MDTSEPITEEQWLRVLEIKSRNYKILSEEFKKVGNYGDHDINMSIVYLFRAIKIRMKLIRKKHCEIS